MDADQIPAQRERQLDDLEQRRQDAAVGRALRETDDGVARRCENSRRLREMENNYLGLFTGPSWPVSLLRGRS